MCTLDKKDGPCVVSAADAFPRYWVSVMFIKSYKPLQNEKKNYPLKIIGTRYNALHNTQ